MGAELYGANCARCHGGAVVAGGTVPDLRYSAYLDNDIWYQVVLEGDLLENGMLNFSDKLSHDQTTAIRDYVIAQANAAVK
jgi:quinohemoprotein ethanol dehydrogenase